MQKYTGSVELILTYSRNIPVNRAKVTPTLTCVLLGELELAPSELLDTFVDTTCWSKGFLVVNGRVVGRYWPDAGPQYTLYVPGNGPQYTLHTIRTR